MLALARASGLGGMVGGAVVVNDGELRERIAEELRAARLAGAPRRRPAGARKGRGSGAWPAPPGARGARPGAARHMP